MKKQTIYIDLDDTIADFSGEACFGGQKPTNLAVAAMFEPGFFLNLKVLPGAKVAVQALIRMGYDVQILSQPVAESAYSYSEKVQWIGMHFPELINKINLTQDKGNFVGAFLIDDNDVKWKDKFNANGGTFVHFDYHAGDHEATWNKVLIYFFLQQPKEAHVSPSHR